MTRSHEASKTVKCQSAAEDNDRRKAYSQLARDNLAAARGKQKYHADKKRRKLELDEGDLVMLRTGALSLFNRASIPKKWRKKWIGPLLVEKKMGPVTY